MFTLFRMRTDLKPTLFGSCVKNYNTRIQNSVHNNGLALLYYSHHMYILKDKSHDNMVTLIRLGLLLGIGNCHLETVGWRGIRTAIV